jgi:hypothetical protein
LPGEDVGSAVLEALGPMPSEGAQGDAGRVGTTGRLQQPRAVEGGAPRPVPPVAVAAWPRRERGGAAQAARDAAGCPGLNEGNPSPPVDAIAAVSRPRSTNQAAQAARAAVEGPKARTSWWASPCGTQAIIAWAPLSTPAAGVWIFLLPSHGRASPGDELLRGRLLRLLLRALLAGSRSIPSAA